MNGWVVAFFTALISSTSYVGWRGGSPERLVAAAFVLAGIATALVPRPPIGAYMSVFWDVLWIDIVLFIALLTVALFADRFWPIWIAAAQLFTLAVHGIRAYDESLLAFAYWLLIGKEAYLMLALLVWGTARHRQRIKQIGREVAWTHERRAATHVQTGRASRATER